MDQELYGSSGTEKAVYSHTFHLPEVIKVLEDTT